MVCPNCCISCEEDQKTCKAKKERKKASRKLRNEAMKRRDKVESTSN